MRLALKSLGEAAYDRAVKTPRAPAHAPRLRIAVAVVLILAGAPAVAGGSGSIRDLTSTTFRSCPTGHKLAEHYFLSADAQSYAEDVEIACLRDPKFAVWLFTAASVCENNPRCVALEKPLAFPREHDDASRPDEPYASPRVVTYKALRYEVGESCALNAQADGDDQDFYWSCATYRSIRKPIAVRTVGATTEVDDIGTDAPHLPLAVFTGGRTPPKAP